MFAKDNPTTKKQESANVKVCQEFQKTIQNQKSKTSI